MQATINTYSSKSGLKFSDNVPDLVGLRAAIVFENILFWVEVNNRKRTNVKDGVSWTYQSVREMSEQIPGVTSKEVRTALTKLEEKGLIRTGFFGGCDRRKWYTLGDSPKPKKTPEPEAVEQPPEQAKADPEPGKIHLPTATNAFAT